MTSQSLNLETKINTLKAVLTNEQHQRAVDTALRSANGDISTALANLKEQLPPTELQKVALAHSLTDLLNDNVPVVRAIVEQPSVANLRDVALHFNVEKLAAIVEPQAVPEGTPGATPDEKKKNFAVALQRRLFTVEPTAVLQRMVQEHAVPIADATVRTDVAKFLNNQPDFNIRTTSVYTALKHPEAFQDIAEDQRSKVVEQLKTLQRVQAISPIPEAVPVLMNANLTSAFQVAEMPESTFLNSYSPALGEETARQVYTNAINNRIRNEHALVTMREAVRGTGLAIIDGSQSLETRMAMMQAVADNQEVPVPLNLEALFGSMDYCECEDCLSVYSPASYFVELLQFLRNNNLGADPTSGDPDPTKNKNIQAAVKDTPLGKLFRRRPDLGCLELTCENTFTVLPYIDLVNEVMESFVVHRSDYHNSNTDPNQREARLEVFNVEDETTSELLAQPQHTNYQAYCILKNAVYPFTLPYHQAIDAIRIFLKYLGTSRYELLDTYRTATETCTNVALTPAEQQELQALHVMTLDRAVDAEFLGMTPEEYIILTEEAFWSKHYFEVRLKKNIDDKVYREKIGVKPVSAYYGYLGEDAEKDMLSTDENPKTGQKGLTFVKKQFLPRTGIQYVDLVELLKTQFINPIFPKGKALTILESIRFSYRFLQTLVDQTSTDPQVRFAKLVDFLEKAQPLVPLLNARLHPDPCQQQKTDWCLDIKDLRNWVYCYFEQIGKLIVLESGEGPQLPIEGQLYTPPPVIPSPPPISLLPSESPTPNNNEGQLIGTLRKDGTLLDANGKTIGQVTATLSLQNNVPVLIAGPVNLTNGKSFIDQFGTDWLTIKNNATDEEPIAYLNTEGLWRYKNEVRLYWTPTPDTCDLDKVRLKHLDGTTLEAPEYDRIQRFIRLWRKMGWTIDETDKALIGLFANPTGTDGGTPAQPGECDSVDFDVFTDDCSSSNGGTNGGCNDGGQTNDWNCPDIVQIAYDITPDLLHQLVAVRKLLDLTGLPLTKLLAFWADISTAGEKSLYASLFLTHNLLGIDKVFQADNNGNYLTQSAKITDHLPVLMAALKLKADDITAIMSFRQLSDALTLPSVSVLYRHSLLAKILHVRVSDLPEVIALFGDPFKNAYQTLELLETWGKMEDAGFTFRQLDYIIRNYDDPLRPLSPTKKTILQITKTLYDGLNAIDHDHQDVTDKDAATDDLVRTKASLLFEQSVVEQIIALLDGTTVYTTNAPANLTFTIPDALAKKLKYSNQKDANPPSASIQVTGILTDDERTQAKALSSSSDWAKAIDRVGKQALHFFNDFLSGIFSNKDDAIKNLLAGDINLPADPKNPAASDLNTAPLKRFYFLQYFLPFLRQRLAHRFIVDTLSGAASLPKDVTDLLLSDVLVVGTSKQPAIIALGGIKAQPAGTTGGWKGYLIPSVDDAYTFIATSDSQPAPLSLDGQSISFPYQQDDPSNIWSSDPVKLKSGKLYKLEITGQSTNQLQWKTATSPKAPIPTSALLPDYSSQGTEEVFTKLYKAALLVNGFNVNVDEINYWQTHAADFDAFDFNAVTLQHWKRLQAYTTLRNSLPKVEMTLLNLFMWASKPDDATKLSEKIAAVTVWKQEDIEKLLKPEHFDLNHPEAFRNEKNLVKLQKAITVANKIGVDIDRLFEWAKPTSKFWVCHQIAEDIRKAIRARYDQEDWEKVVKPLNDQLREDQKQALISYLVVQPDLIEWGVLAADSLFEFFLIDVQMDACMQTSRIKQAISSVQLFVQRCFLGLEDKKDKNGTQIGVPGDALDRDRWEWMQRYRLWEANREVFLYPENWIDPQLRDDKSPFYKELESELLQKDINSQTIQDALKNYLFKVDEVANLKVVGLFLEQDVDKDGKPKVDENKNPVYIKLHIFSRTRNAPDFFYYRYFQVTEKNWYPWEKMQVDIPSYDVENDQGKIIDNGTYLSPVVWNKRLLVFFLQFMKKTNPVEVRVISDPPAQNEKERDPTTRELAELPSGSAQASEFWEIKVAWSEYRNGKWMQKQISREACFDSDPDPNVPAPFTMNGIRYTIQRSILPSIAAYQFVPRVITSSPEVVIDVYREHQAKGAFHFQGSQITQVDKTGTSVPTFSGVATDFHYEVSQIHSLQAEDTAPPSLFNDEPYFDDQKTSVKVHYPKQLNQSDLGFYHPFAHQLLGTINTGNLDTLFDYYLNKIPVDTITNESGKIDAFGSDEKAIYHELKRSYSLYNWEAAFHAPMQLVDRLLKSQQFEQALKMCHYVFNPLAKDTSVWQFLPFREIKADKVLEQLFMGLQPNTPDAADGQINEWRNHPFQPHVIARARPVAYMKWVVMKYIEILIAWGDYLFRQDTIETINQATQLYILAAHLYGPRGQKIPKRGKIHPQTYNSLLDKWDAFSNAMVELELAFPFSNQTPFPIGVSNGVVGLANVFGFATSLYFCIPNNPQLSALRDTIDDRLFKIRHCENIEGVFRQLPLFEPPIDPGLLVQAAAQGLSLSSVLNDLNTPMPNYRFYYLLQKALELCSELKALGNAFLSAKEKGDGEELSQLRAKHESSIQNLVMEVRKQQLEEANSSLDGLQQNRKGPYSRMQYYLKLIGEDLGKAPADVSTDFSELPNQIEQPIDDSGLKLIPYEKEEMDKASSARDLQIGIGVAETLASILHIIPSAVAEAKPFGIGTSSTIVSGWMLGNAAEAVAKGLQIGSSDLSYQSTNAGRKGGFLRQLQDRVEQANNAGYEIKNIDKQILTQQIRINIANQEITNQQKQIDNAQEVEDFLRNKYTNQELYTWMGDQLRTLYYQAYKLAYDLAKKAEKAYRFERGLATSNFIQFGYWNAAYDGLLAGEQLYIGLKQLEAAYQEKRGYDFEITKPISLRQINPMALLQLRETGTCEFTLPEVLFDMERPGDYMRRIKSVALTVPCVVGPYTSLNCTLRLLEHKFRLSAIAKSKTDYPESTDPESTDGTDQRFTTFNVPITAIAVSTGQNDSGVFELNFRDERYIPFEGAGVISKWRIELPDTFRQFDYDTITDVIMQLRYTAVDGGDKLKLPAAGSVQDYIKSVEQLSQQEGLFAAFDLKHDFSNEWYKAMNPPANATERVLMLNNLNERLPIFTKGRQPNKIQATDIYLFTSGALSASALVLTQGTDDFTFTDGSPVGTLKSFVIKGIDNCPISNWQLKIQDTKTELEQLWLLVRYVLK